MTIRRTLLPLMVFCLCSLAAAGKKQTVVAYGTSLTAAGAWVDQLRAKLANRYPGQATVINSGGSGQWSKWGVENLDKRVIRKQPDTVFIEFSINDSVARFGASVAVAKANLETMITRIHAARPACEIILMTMTPGDKYPRGHRSHRHDLAAHYAMYRTVARQRHLLLIDHAPVWLKLQQEHPKQFASLVPDTIHPTPRGCAEVTTPAILQAIGLQASVESANPANRVVHRFPIKVTQGVAVDQDHFYGISNVRISKHSKNSGALVASWQADRNNPALAHFIHLNSGTVVGDRLYCAHSRYGADPNDCTVEIWDVAKQNLKHLKTIRMPRHHGSLTWIDRHRDDSWWMCYAVYGKDKNQRTKLVKYDYLDGKFVENTSYYFPAEVVAKWGRWSCSGGSWGPDGQLYVTGHDHAETYVLTIKTNNTLAHLRTEANMGFFGQAIAWDRAAPQPILWGIIKNKSISATIIPEAAP